MQCPTLPLSFNATIDDDDDDAFLFDCEELFKSEFDMVQSRNNFKENSNGTSNRNTPSATNCKGPPKLGGGATTKCEFSKSDGGVSKNQEKNVRPKANFDFSDDSGDEDFLLAAVELALKVETSESNVNIKIEAFDRNINKNVETLDRSVNSKVETFQTNVNKNVENFETNINRNPVRNNKRSFDEEFHTSPLGVNKTFKVDFNDKSYIKNSPNATCSELENSTNFELSVDSDSDFEPIENENLLRCRKKDFDDLRLLREPYQYICHLNTNCSKVCMKNIFINEL